MLTRLATGTPRSPENLEELERSAIQKVESKCPNVHWLSSYAVLGRSDYMDIDPFVARLIVTSRQENRVMPRTRKHRIKPGTSPTVPAAKDTNPPASLANNGPDRQAMIAEAAYLRAERRSFCPGHELDDWLAAEQEIDSPPPRPDQEAAMPYLG